MKTKLNNSVRKLKHSKKTSKRFNNKIKSAKKLVKMVPKKNLKKSKKQKKTKSVKKMVGGAVVSVNCEDKNDADGDFKECKIRTSVAPNGAVKTPAEITQEKNNFEINNDLDNLFKKNNSYNYTADDLNLIYSLFIDFINIYTNHRLPNPNEIDFSSANSDVSVLFIFLMSLLNLIPHLQSLNIDISVVMNLFVAGDGNNNIFIIDNNTYFLNIFTKIYLHTNTDVFVEYVLNNDKDDKLVKVISSVCVEFNNEYKSSDIAKKNIIRNYLNNSIYRANPFAPLT